MQSHHDERRITRPRRALSLTAAVALAIAGGCSEDAFSKQSSAGRGASYGDPSYSQPPYETQAQDFDSAEIAAEVGRVNPFVIAEHDPLSTFAADVDTASYDLFRRDIQAGYLPAEASVRLEEYVNYFHYAYPKPALDAQHPFVIDLEATPNPLGRDSVLLRIGVQAVDLVANDHADQPTNVVFLVDVSGSMQSEEKLPLVKRVMRRTLDELSWDDRVAIVTYAGGTSVRLASTPLSDRHAIEAAIDGLSAGGSTNGEGGIHLAYAQAEAGRVDGINHVVLMTDGDFNVGASDTAALVSLIEDKRRSGITLTALGFGQGNLNDEMMELVSNAGNGIYGVITDGAQADTYVRERMLSTFVHAARDMKLQVEFNPEHVHAYRLLGYENRDIADEDFRVDAVDAGEVGSGHQVTALYEVVMAGEAIPLPDGTYALDDGAPFDGEREVGFDDLVLVKVRYKDPQDPEPAMARETARALRPHAIAEHVQSASESTQWAVAVAGLTEILRGSPYADAGKLELIELLVARNVGQDDDRLEFQRLLGKARGMLTGRY